MFAKYIMNDKSDYRGSVKLIVRNEAGVEIAYCATEDTTDETLVELIDAEITLVKDQTDGEWDDLRKGKKNKIDKHADKLRKIRLDAGIETVYYEYVQVEKELRKWQSKGSDVNNIPKDLQSWIDATGESIEWVVNDIETQIAGYNAFLSEIRRIRLVGKKQLDICVSQDIDSSYDAVITELDNLLAYAMSQG